MYRMRSTKSSKMMRKTQNRKTRKAGDCKTMGGSPTKSRKESIKSAKKLKSLDSVAHGITMGQMSSVFPQAIKAAKKAIDYANEHPEDEFAKEDAVNKSAIADFWADKADKRGRWRFERRDAPGNSAGPGAEWYPTDRTIVWDLK